MSELAAAFLASFSTQKNGSVQEAPRISYLLMKLSEIARGIEEKRDWKDLLSKVTSLRKEFVEANSILPSYDLGQCELVSILLLRPRVTIQISHDRKYSN